MKTPQGLEKGLDFKKQFLANASKNQDYKIIFIFVCIAADKIKSILSFEMLFHDFCVSKHKQYQFENISQTVILNFFCLLNPQPPNDAIWRFLGLLSCFQKKCPCPLDSAQMLLKSSDDCCAANQYSEIGGVFYNLLENSARSQG